MSKILLFLIALSLICSIIALSTLHMTHYGAGRFAGPKTQQCQSYSDCFRISEDYPRDCPLDTINKCATGNMANNSNSFQSGFFILESFKTNQSSYLDLSNGTNSYCPQGCSEGCYNDADDKQYQKSFDGYHLNTINECEPCMLHCKICQNANSCSKCEDGYDYDGTKSECLPAKSDCFDFNWFKFFWLVTIQESIHMTI